MGGKSSMRKCFAILFFFLFAFASSSYAATTPDYGLNYFGETNLFLRGDLSYSGIGNDDIRPSTANWHAVRFQNVITNDQYPADGSYIPSVSYDIQEQLSTDNFKNREGYHLLPVDQDTIKRYAGYMNGNQDYVWQQVQANVNKYYLVEGIQYINFAQVAYWCGAGNPDMKQVSNDGVNSPMFQTTYQTTPWPYIDRFTAKQDGVLDPPEVHPDGQLHLNANAYSAYDTQITGWITVNDDLSTQTQVFTQNTGASNSTLHYTNDLPISILSKYLKEGSNKLTLTIQDGISRTTTHSITINYVAQLVQPPPTQQNQTPPPPSGPKQVGVPGPALQMQFGNLPSTVQMVSQMNVPVIITNNGDKPVTTNLNFSLTGEWAQVYQYDAFGHPMYRNEPMTETKSSGSITVPAFGKVVWSITDGVERDIGGPNPENHPNMPLSSGSEADAGGVPISTSHYSPYLKVTAQDASDYVSPGIDLYIGTNYPLPQKPRVILAPSDPSLLNLLQH
jgi:hypothetical protein